MRWTARRAPVGAGWKGAVAASAEPAIGKEVHVVALDHSRRNGRLVSLSGTHVTIRTVAGETSIPLPEVRGIRRQSHAILGSTLVGLGAGALVMCASGWCEGEGVVLLPVMMGIGTGAGTLIGTIYNLTTARSRTIYVAPQKTSVSVSPIIGRGRGGVGGSVTW